MSKIQWGVINGDEWVKCQFVPARYNVSSKLLPGNVWLNRRGHEMIISSISSVKDNFFIVGNMAGFNKKVIWNLHGKCNGCAKFNISCDEDLVNYQYTLETEEENIDIFCTCKTCTVL